MGERDRPDNFFKTFGFENINGRFITEKEFIGPAIIWKINQIQKTKVNHTIFWLWIKH